MHSFVATVGLACLMPLAFAQHQHGKHAEMLMKCAEECNKCQRECDSCAAHCGHMLAEGKKDHLATLRTCQDCATHCRAAAEIMARHGPFSDTICKACLDACIRCAKECEKHPNDAAMKRCAEACRQCEKACREMLTHLTTAKTSTLNLRDLTPRP